MICDQLNSTLFIPFIFIKSYHDFYHDFNKSRVTNFSKKIDNFSNILLFFPRCRMRMEMTKMKTDTGTATKRLQKLELERSDFEKQMKQALASMRNAEQETLIHRRQYIDKQQQVEILIREKNILARNQETLGEQIKRLNQQLVVGDYGRRKIEAELDDSARNVMEVTKQLQSVEKERDKHSQTIKDLAYQVNY